MSTGPVPQVLLLLRPQLRRLQAPTGAYLNVIGSQKPNGEAAPTCRRTLRRARRQVPTPEFIGAGFGGGQPTVRRPRSALRTDAFGPPISRVRSLLAEMLAKLFGEFTDRGQASAIQRDLGLSVS